MEYSLQHVYPAISDCGRLTFGGSQKLLHSTVLQRCGCGVVAALDLVRYLHLYRPGFRTDFFTGIADTAALPLPVYDLCAQRMCRTYVPVIYPVGATGFGLAAGLNRSFRRYDLPLHAHWGVAQTQLWQEIERQLADDLPVILSIGSRFPKIWESRGAALHRKKADATMEEAASVKSHYVTVVGCDEDWLCITSWGRKYYLEKKEFRRYCDKVSLSLLCNIVCIRPVMKSK